MAPDLVERGRLGEPGHVGVLARSLVASPCVVGRDDLPDVGVGQFPVDPIHKDAEFPSVEKERLAASVTPLAIVLVAGDEPEANRDLGRAVLAGVF